MMWQSTSFPWWGHSYSGDGVVAFLRRFRMSLGTGTPLGRLLSSIIASRLLGRCRRVLGRLERSRLVAQELLRYVQAFLIAAQPFSDVAGDAYNSLRSWDLHALVSIVCYYHEPS